MQVPDDHISGYIDGQSLNEQERQTVEQLLGSNVQAKAEYAALQSLKQRLRQSSDALLLKAPDAARQAVLMAVHAMSDDSETKPSEPEAVHSVRFFDSGAFGKATTAANRSAEPANRRIWSILQKHRGAVAVSTVVVFLIVGATALFVQRSQQPAEQAVTEPRRGNSSENLSPDPSAAPDFRVVALKNFHAVEQGVISLQHKTSSFEELQAFFKQQGIAFTLVRPNVSARLLGGVVSEEHGEKSAHLVYQANDHLLYMWQIPEHELMSSIRHAPQASGFLLDTSVRNVIAHNGDWYWEEKPPIPQEQATLAIWEDKQTLCVMISQLPRKNMQPLFQ